jgi:hypothetical protein
MSKWINQDLFGQFQEQKRIEKETPQRSGGVRRSDFVWETPEKGTQTDAKVYTGRFLPDPKGVFYKQYYYHMFRSGEKWNFIICSKTDKFENFCPFCSATQKLYMGTATDKKMANNYKRKKKFVGNFFLVDDPRDADREEEKKVNGKVKLYEFPNKVEMKLKEEITDQENGLGASIFDPSEGGYNFILKILATRASLDGMSWPDYTNSTFSRRPTAIGTDAEIEEIMQSCVDINEYVNSLKKTDEDMLKIIKDEMLYDLIKDEYKRYVGTVKPTEQERQTPADTSADTEPPWNEGSTSEPKVEEGLSSDEDLLKQLDDM